MFLLIRFCYAYSPLCPLIYSIPLLWGKKYKQIFKGQIDTLIVREPSNLFPLSLRASSVCFSYIIPSHYSSYSKILIFTEGSIECKISASLPPFIYPILTPLPPDFQPTTARTAALNGCLGLMTFKSLSTLKFKTAIHSKL